MAATPSPRPVRPRPSVVVAETVTGAPAASTARPPPRRGEPEARTVADHLDGDVADRVPGRADPGGGLGEQGRAGRARPGGVGRAELGAQVAEAGARKQRVAGGVRRDVAVGVTLEAVVLVGPRQPGEVHRDAGGQAVHVDADADARHPVYGQVTSPP